MSLIGEALVYILLLLIAMGARGWCIAILWGWFVVPVFDLPSLSTWQAYGLALVTAVLVPTSQSSGRKELPAWFPIVVGIMISLIMVGFGWLVQWLFLGNGG